MVLGGVFVFGLGILWVRGKVTFLVRLRFPIFRHKPTLFSIGKFSLMMLLGGIWATSTAKCIAFENVVSTASKYYVDDAEPALSNAAVWVHCSKKRSVFLPHSMTSAWESLVSERPAALLVRHEMPATFMSMWFATTTSGTVDMPSYMRLAWLPKSLVLLMILLDADSSAYTI